MAHLLLKQLDTAADTHGEWLRVPLDADEVALAVIDGGLRLVDAQSDEAAAVLFRSRPTSPAGDADERDDSCAPDWVLLTRADVALNGRSVLSRVALLRDRDELRISGETAFISFEQRPAVIECDDDDEPTCARCRTSIVRGQQMVVCPSCGLQHHEDADGQLPCWTFAEQCALCPQPTPLDGDFTFHPEDL